MQRLLCCPLGIVLVTLAATTFFGAQIPEIQINNNVEVFVPADSPEKRAYDRMLDIYGSQQMVGVVISVERGSVLDPEVIGMIVSLTHGIEALSHVDSVTSLTNADHIAGTSAGMEVSPLLADTGTLRDDVELLRRRIFDWHEMYRGNLISDDLMATQMIVLLEARSTTEQREGFYAELLRLLDDHSRAGVSFAVGGEPVVTVELKRSMIGDLTYLIPLVIVVVALVLLVSFRSPAGVALPMLTVGIATVWAVGIMALLGIYFSMISTVIPVLLIAVGSAYAIHLYSHYTDALAAVESPTIGHRQLLITTLRNVGKPIVLTALTTAAGFASIATSQLAPMRHFGIINAVGVLAALVITCLFVPSLILLFPPKHRPHQPPRRTGRGPDRVNKALMGFYSASGRHPVRVLLLSGALVAVCIYGLTRVVVDNSMIEYFDSDSPVRISDQQIREKFSGTKPISILVEGRLPGDLTDPVVLAAMDDLGRYLERNHPEVGRVLSFSDFIKRMNKVMHVPTDTVTEHESFENGDDFEFGSFFESEYSEPDNRQALESSVTAQAPAQAPIPAPAYAADTIAVMDRALARAGRLDTNTIELIRLLKKELNIGGEAYNEIPLDPARYQMSDQRELRNLISQYLLVYSGGLSEFADDALEPQRARILVQLRSTSTADTLRVSESALAFAGRHFPEGYKVSVAGFADIEAAVTRLIVRSQLTSVLVAMLIVFLIVAVAHRSALAGLYGILPLSLSIVINFGVMGLAGINLDVATAMIASISIGIGVDYTIHVLAAYRRERLLSDDLEAVTRNAIGGTGKAIVFNAVSVAAGFLVLTVSNFNPLRYVGLLVALTMITSCIAAITLLPTMLNLFQPGFVLARGEDNDGGSR